ELTEQTRTSIHFWLEEIGPTPTLYIFPKPDEPLWTPKYAPICALVGRMDGPNWSGPDRLRDTLATPVESVSDLQTYRQPPSGPASPWPFKIGINRPLFWHRGGRRAYDLRTNRNLGAAIWNDRPTLLEGRPI